MNPNLAGPALPWGAAPRGRAARVVLALLCAVVASTCAAQTESDEGADTMSADPPARVGRLSLLVGTATLTERHKDSTPECVSCHVVGYKQPGGYGMNSTGAVMTNVQCENCHGMGTKHPDHGAVNAAVVGPDVCLSCHTHEQNPNFDYEEALKHIVHWRQ